MIENTLELQFIKMSNLQAEIAKFTGNQAVKKLFKTLYRLVKTHTLLKNLYLSEALSRDVYSREIKQTLERLSMVKQQLSAYDITRFCELWGITTEYEGLNFSNDALVSSIKVPLGVAKLANLLPRVNDEVFQATKYEEIHQIFSTFCIELNKLKLSDSSISSSFKKIINDLIALQSRLVLKYERLTEQIESNDKDFLRQGLTRFRVQFQKSYNF